MGKSCLHQPLHSFEAISAALLKHILMFLQKQTPNEESNGEQPNIGGVAEDADVQSEDVDGIDVLPDQPQGAAGGASQPKRKRVGKGSKPSKTRLSKPPQFSALKTRLNKPQEQVSVDSHISRY